MSELINMFLNTCGGENVSQKRCWLCHNVGEECESGSGCNFVCTYCLRTYFDEDALETHKEVLFCPFCKNIWLCLGNENAIALNNEQRTFIPCKMLTCDRCSYGIENLISTGESSAGEEEEMNDPEEENVVSANAEE